MDIHSGVLAVALLPSAANRLRWRPLLVVSSLVAVGWAVSLALVDGVPRLSSPIATEAENLHDVPEVHGVRDFFATSADGWFLGVSERRRWWIAGQLAVGLTVQSVVATNW